MTTKDNYILLVNPPHSPDWMLSNGRLLLDVPEGFTFPITKRREELTDVNKLQGQGILAMTLPSTSKNKHVLAPFFSCNTYPTDIKPLEVRCVAGGRLYLPQNEMVITRTDDRNGINIELTDSDTFWVTGAENTLLRDIDFGTFLYNEDELLTNFDQYIWQDGNPLVWHPLCHYGQFYRKLNFDNGGVAVEDFLPWISVPGTLKKGFAQLGYVFESPFLESEKFRRLWACVVSDKIDYDNKAGNFVVDLSMPADQEYVMYEGELPQPLAFESEVKDIMNQHQLRLGGISDVIDIRNTSFFTCLDAVDTDVRVSVNGEVDNPNNYPVRFDIEVILHQGRVSLTGLYDIVLNANESKKIDWKFDFNLNPGQSAYLVVRALRPLNGPAATIDSIFFKAGTTLNWQPISNRIYREDTVDLKQIMGNYTFFDFFKGIVNIVGGKVSTDFSSNTVSLFPNRKTKFFDDELEGFFFMPDTGTPVNITSNIVPGSRQIPFDTNTTPKKVILRFKDTNDKKVESLKLSSDSPLYSRVIDIPSGKVSEPLEITNPIFEPLANTSFNGLEVPALWDNDDGKRSSRLGARIGFAVGNLPQPSGSTEQALDKNWVFEFVNRTNVPYLSQLPTAYVRTGTGVEQPKESVVFGGALPNNEDLYTQFWKFSIKDLLYSLKVNFLVDIDIELFETLTFREQIVWTYEGETTVGRLLEINDFRPGTGLPTILVLKPDNDVEF